MSAELALLGEILRRAQDPDLSLAQFSDGVASSPRLASEIVRIANSALYGMEGRIARLDRAVLILGQRAVANIATSVLVAERTRALRIGPIRGDALWLHSLETGICAELSARCLALADPGEAYLAGLLHDLAIPELFQEHGEAYLAVIAGATSEGTSLERRELETLGESHATRLRSLAEAWGFPEAIRAAIGAHHEPADAPEGARGLASLVAAAHGVIAESATGWCDPGAQDEGLSAVEALGLLPDDLASIRAITAEKLKEAAVVYR